MQRFFGGPPLTVLIRLAVTSVIVGVVLSAIGINPQNLLSSIQRLFWHIYDMGYDAIEWALTYFILGALVVIPIWFVGRLWKTVGAGPRSSHTSHADDLL